jgi:FtsP/CotA-like multicopper oxidase with cupredoxin domain
MEWIIKNKSVVLAVLVALALVWVGFSGGTQSTITLSGEQRNALINDVQNAYPANAPESTGVISYDITAAEGEVELVNGYTTKVWAYNGIVPGPEIRLKLGETLRLNFTNKLPQDTTVHFHGVRVPNAMDGVPGVTQDPIKSGESFVYEFTPKDAGTFWFHPHVRSSEQIGRGLYGVLIVEDETSEQYSQDLVWVLDDWRLDDTAQIAEPIDHPHDLMHDGRWGNVITVNGNTDEVLTAQPGERIRLRLVNTANARIYQLNFGELEVESVAVDGLYSRESFNPNDFKLAPGNRIDVDITIPRNTPEESFIVYDTYTDERINLATIAVSGEPGNTASFETPSNVAVPTWDSLAGVMPDKEYVLEGGMGSMMGMGMMGDQGNIWRINGKSFPDYDPAILDANTVNIIRFTNKSVFPHPMHLHGQFFKVITRNGRAVDEGFFRDTVLVERDEVVDVAVVPQDLGTWALHCHTLEHAEAGMMTLVEVK